MSETRILYLSHQASDDSIDFGLLGAPLTDSLIASKRKEIAECLRDLAKRLDSREYPFCNLFARLADGQPTFYEDQLPDDMTDGEYAAWFAQSKVVDGVRMGPDFPPAQVTRPCPACEAAARERVICACGDEIGQAERIGLSQIGAICGNCAVGRKDYDARMELADLRARIESLAADMMVESAAAAADGDWQDAQDLEWQAKRVRAILEGNGSG